MLVVDHDFVVDPFQFLGLVEVVEVVVALEHSLGNIDAGRIGVALINGRGNQAVAVVVGVLVPCGLVAIHIHLECDGNFIAVVELATILDDDLAVRTHGDLIGNGNHAVRDGYNRVVRDNHIGTRFRLGPTRFIHIPSKFIQRRCRRGEVQDDGVLGIEPTLDVVATSEDDIRFTQKSDSAFVVLNVVQVVKHFHSDRFTGRVTVVIDWSTVDDRERVAVIYHVTIVKVIHRRSVITKCYTSTSALIAYKEGDFQSIPAGVFGGNDCTVKFNGGHKSSL